MKKRKIGAVTSEERDKIYSLYERRSALMELFKALPDLESKEMEILYDKLINDLGKVITNYNTWWNNICQKYGWNNSLGKQWEINFDSCEIFLGESKKTILKKKDN